MVGEKLKTIYDAYVETTKKIDAWYKKAIEDCLKENGLGGDVYNKKGRRGRLIVEKNYGNYELRFYAYTKSGELSKLASGYVWVWSGSDLSDYRSAEKEGADDGNKI